METKHTRGPWHASPTYPCAIYDEGEVLVGLCEGRDGVAKRYANARLIAAAPDLLESVSELLHCMALANWEADPIAEKARAAMAKALGKE